MGFWSTLGGVAKGVADGVAAKTQEANVLAEEYRGESDDYLKRKAKNGSLAEKMAAAKVLRERGFGQ